MFAVEHLPNMHDLLAISSTKQTPSKPSLKGEHASEPLLGFKTEVFSALMVTHKHSQSVYSTKNSDMPCLTTVFFIMCWY